MNPCNLEHLPSRLVKWKWIRWPFATPWTVVYQAPLSMAFPRQEYWRGLPFPSPGGLPNPGIEPEVPSGAQARSIFLLCRPVGPLADGCHGLCLTQSLPDTERGGRRVSPRTLIFTGRKVLLSIFSGEFPCCLIGYSVDTAHTSANACRGWRLIGFVLSIPLKAEKKPHEPHNS